MLGVTFGNKHSYNDWGIWLEDTHINPPLPKRYIVDVPARNGLLDLTPELTPTIRFENRTLTFNFRVKAGDWSTLVSQIYGDIHGKTLDVVSDLDPNWHWHGCVTVDDFSSDERTGKLVITVDADPFKLSNTENSYTVNGNGTITCVVDRMEISPAFELTAPTTVIYGDSSYVLESTTTVEKTLSGDIVSFVDGTANPAVDLIADIEAVQSGSGDPSPTNIRPISGWDEVNVYVTGKNLLPNIANSSTINGVTFTKNSDGSVTANGTASGNALFYFLGHQNKNIIYPSGNYIMSGCPSGGTSSTYRISAYNNQGSGYQHDYGSGATFPSLASGMKFAIVVFSGTTVNNLVFKPMIRLASVSDATYEPYNGETYTIDLNDTRYGGTLDVTTGRLTGGKVDVDLGTLDWMYTSSYNGIFYADLPSDAKLIIGTDGSICSNYAPTRGSDWQYLSNGEYILRDGLHTVGRCAIVIKDNSYTDATAFKTAMSGVQLVYELATPQTYQLSPQQVRTVLGQNNIWADSGEVEVTYLAQDFAGKTFYIPDLELTEGSHELTIQGTGVTKVTYTNGRL